MVTFTRGKHHGKDVNLGRCIFHGCFWYGTFFLFNMKNFFKGMGDIMLHVEYIMRIIFFQTDSLLLQDVNSCDSLGIEQDVNSVSDIPESYYIAKVIRGVFEK